MQSHRSNPNRSGKSESRTEPAHAAADYRRWGEQNADTGNYFQFFRAYLHLLSPAAAIIVQSLINLGRTKSKEGWVKCTSGFLQGQLGMTQRVQLRAFAELQKKGYVEVRRAGVPPRRFARVFLEKMWADRDQYVDQPAGSNSTEPSSLNSTEPYHIKDTPTEYPKTHNGRPNRGRKTARFRRDGEGTDMDGGLMDFPPAKPEPVLADYELTDRLHKALRDKGLTPANRYSRTAWAGWFARLRRDYPVLEIDGVLGWYTARLGDRYVPEAWSAKSFRDKFPAIRKAMARAAEKNPDIQVSDAAYEIVRVLTDTVNWKHGVPPDLPVAVQLGLASMLAFRACLLDAKHNGVAAGFVAHLLRDHGFDDGFVERWFRGLAWVRGPLVPRHVPGPANPDFQKWGRGQADRYGDENDWNALMKEIGHAS